MKKCIFSKEEITVYCYGEFTHEKTQEIEGHFALCPRCKQEAEAIKQVIALVKESKLKPPPAELLSGYTDEIRERLSDETRVGIFGVLREKISNLLDGLASVFSPRLMPAFATACVLILAVVLIKHGRVSSSLAQIPQDFALLDDLGEDTDEAILTDNDELAQEIKNSDLIMLAQLDDEEDDYSDLLESADELDELDEEIENGDIEEYLQSIDDLEIDSAIG